jgi:uncharacterized protein (TIGR00369 family)
MSEDEFDPHPNRGFNPSNEQIVEQLRDHIEDHRFIRELGISVESYDEGALRATVPHQDRYANPGMEGTLHGGIVVSILDTIMGFTLMAAAAEDSTVDSGPTINLNVNFLDAVDDDIEAVGEVVRLGSATAVVDGTLREPVSGDIVATGQGVWRVYQRRD